MNWTSALAIYLLFWVLSAFLVMPFGVKTADEVGVELVPGQADSAPANFSGRRIIIRTTILASILFGLYYANYVYGWITPGTIGLTPPQD
jgi:predicted secreted protein